MEKVLELSDQEFKITMIIKLKALMEKTREHERQTNVNRKKFNQKEMKNKIKITERGIFKITKRKSTNLKMFIFHKKLKNN